MDYAAVKVVAATTVDPLASMLFGPTVVPSALTAACKEAASHCVSSTKSVATPVLASAKDEPIALGQTLIDILGEILD